MGLINDDDTLPATPDSAPPPSPRAADVPASIARFEIDSKLGEGGMGVVLLATDPLLGRRVAIKVLRGNAIGDSAKRRLLREAQSTAQISHENVIVVHDVGTHQDQVYLAMEYVAGETLRKRQARCTMREILELYTRAGRGLQAAHDAGLVQRDFKPDNVLVGTDGRLRVTDFGLVAQTDAPPETFAKQERIGDNELAIPLTLTGAILGTPRYMAPEQHAGESIDARADQFAFCVALYEALYGQSPFVGATYAEIAANIRNGKRTPLPASKVPDRIRNAVLRGLSPDRDDRFASMRDLLAQLEPPAPTSRKRIAELVVGVIAVAIVAFVAIRMKESPPAARPVLVGTSNLDVTNLRAAMAAFDESQTHFIQGNYDGAIQGFQEAYAALATPQFVFDIGASYYLKGKRDGDAEAYQRAIATYREYMKADPIAPIASSIPIINAEIERLQAGGDRRPSTQIAELPDPEIRGLLVVTSVPTGATVYLDDPTSGPVGVTPWSGSLDGRHAVYVAMPGYTTMQQVQEFDSGRFMVVSALLRTMQ